jgi:uncharacterized protein YcaQ
LPSPRSLFPPTTLKRALETLGYVQADPIRAPARAQDLTLRHRVKGYRAGDLERHYAALGIEEDFFLNYGFVTRPLHVLMHPRSKSRVDRRTRGSLAQRLLAFVRERGPVHPREIDDHFAHGRVVNYWGGSSSATTHLLGRCTTRACCASPVESVGSASIQPTHARCRAVHAERRGAASTRWWMSSRACTRRCPASSLSIFTRRLRYAVSPMDQRTAGAIQRARTRLAHARVDGVDWYWPAGERPSEAAAPAEVRLLAPFDPVVHDRARFEMLWGWQYRFEAYTPRRSASAATTRCRCSGATASSAGGTCR